MVGKGLMDKMLGFMGFEEEEENIQEEKEFQPQGAEPVTKKKAAVLSLHAQKQMRVMVVTPQSFDESQSVADHLKNRRPVIINLEEADKEMAKRFIDFISGATYALSGNMQKVGNGIFLFVPSNVDIAGEPPEEETTKSFFSWVGRTS